MRQEVKESDRVSAYLKSQIGALLTSRFYAVNNSRRDYGPVLTLELRTKYRLNREQNVHEASTSWR